MLFATTQPYSDGKLYKKVVFYFLFAKKTPLLKKSVYATTTAQIC
jgi:hypothetical protein